jgi:hypothetical protein
VYAHVVYRVRMAEATTRARRASMP